MYKLMQLSNIKLTRVLFDVVYTKDTDKTKGNRLSHYMQSTLITEQKMMDAPSMLVKRLKQFFVFLVY